MSATVHIAGFPVNVGGHLRQLCAWCGERLIDVDLSCVMASMKEGGSPPDPYGTWEANALVKVDGNYSGVVEHDGALPANACAKKMALRLVTTEPHGS